MKRTALLAVLIGVGVTPAVAQVPPAGSPLPRVLPAQPPAVAPPATGTAPQQAPPAPEETLAVTSVSLEGVTAYPKGTFDRITRELTGAAVPLARVEAARVAILRRYRDDGYVLSGVSVASDQGALRFIVTEGRIASVKLSADIGPAGTRVLRFLERLTQKVPIDEATLERYLLLAQDVPGVTLRAVLRPVRGEPGALDLIAEVSRAPFSGLATSDNYASRFTGPIESLFVLDANSFSSFGERTEFSYYHAWPNSQNFGQVSEEAYIGDSGLRMRVYGGYGRTVPTGALASIGYLGTTTVFGAGVVYPLIRSRTETLNLFGNFDALESEVSVESGGSRGRASFDSLRVLRVGADYARSDLLLGTSRSAVNEITVRVSGGLPTFGATPEGTPTLPRVGEATDFTKVDVRLARTQTLFSPYPGATVALRGVVAGQFTNNVLPPAEEFYLTGLQYLRGYETGQITGDRALTTTAELQFNTTLDLSALRLPDAVPVQVYGFYDWGETWQHDPASLSVHAASTGIGLHVSATRYADIDLLGAVRLNRYPTGSGPTVSPSKAAIFLWRVLARF